MGLLILAMERISIDFFVSKNYYQNMSDISILPIILLLFTSLTGATSSDEPIKKL
jgi:hypothetical protein